MQLQYKKFHPDAIVPTRAYSSDSGLDLYSIPGTNPIILQPLERAVVDTGIGFKLPKSSYFMSNNPDDDCIEIMYEGQVRPKSGRSAKEGLAVLNSPGTVDNSYIDSVKVILVNLSSGIVAIHPGQKIAQFVVCPIIIPILLTEVDDLAQTDRGINGFGSTGI